MDERMYTLPSQSNIDYDPITDRLSVFAQRDEVEMPDGTVLTAHEVVMALKALTAPKPELPQPGETVEKDGQTYVVMDSSVICDDLAPEDDEIALVNVRTGAVYVARFNAS